MIQAHTQQRSPYVPLDEYAKAAATLDNNPKARCGALKPPLHLIPPVADYHLARVLAHGAAKYGPFNWRKEAISVSTYVGAMRRHLNLWWDGQDNAVDSGEHHVAHIMASCALILDAVACDQLVDDRPPNGHAAEVMGES